MDADRSSVRSRASRNRALQTIPIPNEETMKVGGFLDDVTGLANRVMMHSHLRETLGTFAELHIPFSIVCIEATELGKFRTRCGQDAATAMLRVMARTLRNTVWPSDFVGRWSEDQFLVILNGCSEEALQAVGERMGKMMAGATIEWWGEEISVAISIGRASARAGDTVESLLERALQSVAGNRPRPGSQAAAAERFIHNELTHVRDHRHRGCLRRGGGRLSDGARQPARADSAGGTGHHRRRRGGNRAGRQSSAHPQEDCGRHWRASSAAPSTTSRPTSTP